MHYIYIYTHTICPLVMTFLPFGTLCEFNSFQIIMKKKMHRSVYNDSLGLTAVIEKQNPLSPMATSG